MILTLIGLSLNFLGTCFLTCYAWYALGKPKPIIFPIYGKEDKIVGYHREKKVKEGYKEVNLLTEEWIFFISLVSISLGFLLQILDIVL